MKEIEIHLPGAKDQKRVELAIESVCKTQNLQLRSKGSLQKFPGCTHWHYQKAETNGTLEITYWPAENRCWIPLQDGRAKPWVLEMANVLKAEIEKKRYEIA